MRSKEGSEGDAQSVSKYYLIVRIRKVKEHQPGLTNRIMRQRFELDAR
jgi:hypothetical protein